ncbi:MAG: hypothetical protein ACTIKR_03575 [Advenella sp.]|uniref:hypothetical protein n=1 Tax=unclassified Advenella TaxID=2685285 RepID=UPI00186696DE|nr:hypothetical protein [Advenella sp. FME57]
MQDYLGPAQGGLRAGSLASLWPRGRALVIGGSACALVVGLFSGVSNTGLRQSLWQADIKTGAGRAEPDEAS